MRKFVVVVYDNSHMFDNLVLEATYFLIDSSGALTLFNTTDKLPGDKCNAIASFAHGSWVRIREE